MHVLEVSLSAWEWAELILAKKDDYVLHVMFFFFLTARMPTSPLENKEALKEVQEAPQETIPLSIGS